MRKARAGSKRKANQMEEENQKEDEVLKVESTKASTSRGKRIKAAAPKPDKEQPEEYFEEKRNLEDLWQAAFPVGTEWDQLDSVYQFKWNFSNLENAFEEGGVLNGKKVYIFSCTESLYVGRVILIPIVVAVVSPVFPPSDKIGIKSVQRVEEEIIPMKQMKMDWVPYIPLEYRGNQVERLKKSHQIFILNCTQRRASLRNLKIEQLKKFEYCLPYFYQPLKEDELDQSTAINIIFPAEPAPVICEFDWELDEIEEFVDGKVKNEEKVREAKKANREARESLEKAISEMSKDTKDAFEEMRIYKFYPVQTPDTPDISMKSHFINRYYGKAHEVL
ncbi:hypothetical protein BVC80_645g5 [Macleaya cordata]|uniref:Protein HEAT INTOLERANT 4-like n=1 Tax=Macleaya cordata TaxID=56857 RepID=A0A200QJZ0_MACCD|nr:hypothetical protein BVC80_645g5 [Macleaya cordata]